MTIKIYNTPSGFDLRFERVFGRNSQISKRLGNEVAGALKDDLEDIVNTIRKRVLSEVEGELNSLVKDATKEILGNNAFSRGVSNAFDTAFTQVIAGRGLDARSISNSAARAFTPIVDDFVRKSSTQVADEFSALLGLAQRNS